MCPSKKRIIIKFLHEFSKLSHAEQKIFLFCLENCPHPRPYTGDLGRISQATGLSRTTVFNALQSIAHHQDLHALVAYIRSANIKELIAAERFGSCEVGGSLGK